MELESPKLEISLQDQRNDFPNERMHCHMIIEIKMESMKMKIFLDNINKTTF